MYINAVDTTMVVERLGALAEPSRFRIVELLRTGSRSVGEIVDTLGLGQPQVSRHLRILSESGLVEAHRQAQRRIYRLRPRPFEELNEWFATFAGVWEDRLDKLDRYLERGMGDEGPRA
jgi:DNA-binding transcriptional ArsR family regulator